MWYIYIVHVYVYLKVEVLQRPIHGHNTCCKLRSWHEQIAFLYSQYCSFESLVVNSHDNFFGCSTKNLFGFGDTLYFVVTILHNYFASMNHREKYWSWIIMYIRILYRPYCDTPWCTCTCRRYRMKAILWQHCIECWCTCTRTVQGVYNGLPITCTL